VSFDYDVIVVGGGNAAMCAALAAREQGARVVVLERAPREERGGNSAYTAGTMRAVYEGADDVKKLVPDLSDEIIANTDFGSYSAEEFFDDMARVTRYRTHPDLCEVLVTRSRDTLNWMRTQGMRFEPSFHIHSFNVGGRRKLFGGVAVGISGAGIGLVDALYASAERRGIDIRYEARVGELLRDGRTVNGVRAHMPEGPVDLHAKSVVLACGGFEANADWRTRYLGAGWDLAKVRGTRFNTGDGIRMALDVGAQPYGHWSGCHATEWDLNAPDFGDRAVGDLFKKRCYQFSIMVNNEGRRFVDEGAEFRTHTYAKYGSRILAQPGQVAWQIFDSKVLSLLQDEYHINKVARVKGNTLEELAAKMDGVNAEQLLRTIREYNAAVQTDIPFGPNVLDGRATRGLAIPKSNWAHTIADGPFEAYAVTCGITYTFGGVKITPESEVVDMRDVPIRGLYSAGEMVGGVFYFNYPGSSGLTNGAVFGRIAGCNAAKFSLGNLAPA
jgi:tricarballylate dehydrogenase